MAVAAITNQICGSRRQVMPRAFPDLHSRSTMTVVALVNTTQSGDTMLPVMVAFTVQTSRAELSTDKSQFRFPIHRRMLYCLGRRPSRPAAAFAVCGWAGDSRVRRRLRVRTPARRAAAAHSPPAPRPPL